MIAATFLDREGIARVCEAHEVTRLRVFGSALTGRFDPETSDIDFLVDFRSDAPKGIRAYFGFKEALEQIVGRDVDLIEAKAVRNPYFAQRVFAEAVDLYAV